jgi:hypothetical protein
VPVTVQALVLKEIPMTWVVMVYMDLLKPEEVLMT